MAKIQNINFWCYETSKFRFTLFQYDWSKFDSSDNYQKLYDEWDYQNIWNYKYPNATEQQMIQWCEKAAKEWVKSKDLVDFLNDEYNAYFDKWSNQDDESLDLSEDDFEEEKISNQHWFDQISHEVFEAFQWFMERKKSRFQQSENLEKDIDEYLMLITYKKLENQNWYKTYQEMKDYLIQEYKK